MPINAALNGASMKSKAFSNPSKSTQFVQDQFLRTKGGQDVLKRKHMHTEFKFDHSGKSDADQKGLTTLFTNSTQA